MMSFFRVTIKKYFLPLLLLASILIGWGLPSTIVEAHVNSQDDSDFQVFSLADFGYQSDINFQCVNAENTLSITFPKNWEFSSPAQLNLNFSHYELLNPISTLSVEWNGELLGTVQLSEENAQNGTIEISVPADKIIQGYNALTVSFLMGISDNFYEDYNNQSIWAVVHNDSSIEVSPKIIARETELNLAPEIFIDSSLLAENNVTLLIPESPSIQHLNAVAVMSTKLGQLADWRNINVQIMTTSEARQSKPSGNLILLATVDELEDFSKVLLPEIDAIYDQYTEHNPLEDEDGVISIQESPLDDLYQVLILTGNTYDAMEKSARAAAFDELYEQSDGTWAVVRSLTNVIDRVSDPFSIAMSDLGYADQTVTGTREVTIQYNLPVSSLWNVDGEAWIDLDFSHSELINKDLSSVSVLINALPVASFDLNTANAENGHEEIRVPLRYLKVGENSIAFKINMQFSDEFIMMQDSCNPRTSPRAWFNISSDTTIRLPDVPRQIVLDLSNFPYGFSDPFTFNGFAIGVPTALNHEVLKGLVNISMAFGKATYGNPAAIELKSINDDLSQFDSYDYTLLLGTTDGLVNEVLNAALPLPIDEETGELQNDSPLLLVETLSGTQAFLQTFQNEQSTIYLVLFSKGMDGITLAGEFLANPGNLYSLQGNVAVITSAENASAYQIEQSKSSTTSFTQISNDQTLSFLSNYQSIWIIRITIGVAVLSLIIIIIALFRKKPSDKEP